MVQCQSCGGTFEPILPDGMLYFHRCPPLSVAELAGAVQAGTVKLPIDPLTQAPETPDVAVNRRVYERAPLRDENVTATGAPKAEGHGVLELDAADVAPTVVSVAVAPFGPAVPPTK